MIIAFPLMTHTMQRALILSKRPSFSRKLTTRALVIDESASRARINNLRNTIAVPQFKLSTIQKIIQPHTVNLSREGMDDLTEYIIWKATEYRTYEKKYAAVLKQLRLYDSSQLLGSQVLHSAVISNLPHVTQELLLRDKNWVHARDLHNCIPLHYAPSTPIAKMLLDKGSDIEARDRDLNTPLHTVSHIVVPFLLTAGANRNAKNNLFLRVPGFGWQSITPWRKAVDEGDVQKCRELFYCNGCIGNEEMILMSLADLRFWRTKNPAYLEIKNMILECGNEYSD